MLDLVKSSDRLVEQNSHFQEQLSWIRALIPDEVLSRYGIKNTAAAMKEVLVQVERELAEAREDVEFYMGEGEPWPPEQEEWKQLHLLPERTQEQTGRLQVLARIITDKTDDRKQWHRADRLERELEKKEQAWAGCALQDIKRGDEWKARAGSAEGKLERVNDDNDNLRRLLWLRHGCPWAALYGDDGKLDCNKCVIDFRAPVDEIAGRFTELGNRALADSRAIADEKEKGES